MVRKDDFTKLFLKADKLERNFINRIDELIQRRAAIENLVVRPQTLKLTTDSAASSTFVLSTDEHTHPQSVLYDGTDDEFTNSFETGLDGWTLNATGSSGRTTAYSTDGLYSVLLEAVTGFGGYTDSIEKPIKTGTLTFDVRIESFNGGVRVLQDGVEIYNSGLGSTRNINDITLNVIDGNINIRPTSQPGFGADIYVDNIRAEGGSFHLWDGSSYTAEDTLVKVVNLNNTFIEKFNHEEFINNSLTTGTISSTAQTATLDSGQQVTSEVIYKDTPSISKIQIDVVSDSNSAVVVYYSTDGSTFNNITLGDSLDISPTDTLYYRIKNDDSQGGALPLTLPGDLAAGETVVVNEVRVVYS